MFYSSELWPEAALQPQSGFDKSKTEALILDADQVGLYMDYG
jgi:hypothetical protein